MKVDPRRPERKNTQREPTMETEKIEIRQVISSLERDSYSPQLAVAVRELEFEIRTLLPAARPHPGRPGFNCESAKRAADEPLPFGPPFVMISECKTSPRRSANSGVRRISARSKIARRESSCSAMTRSAR